MQFVTDAESLLASGCDEGAVFFGDVTQHVMLAQQRGWQAFWLGALTRMHVRAAVPKGAATSVTTAATEMIIRSSIEVFIAQVRLRVEAKRSRKNATVSLARGR